tara:strand:+ start:1195 stop:1728 length:534 start_codon:yes stop_codon:yes gene_type:complete
MDSQIDLFSEPVSVNSPRFLKRLAGVLVARSGTTQAAALDLAEKAIDGTLCPCCGAGVKLYKRSINRGQVRALTDLVERFSVGVSFESKEINARGGDYAKLIDLGLLWRDDARRWHVTQKGQDFARGERSVNRHSFWFMGELVGLSVSTVKVGDPGSGESFTVDRIETAGLERVIIK